MISILKEQIYQLGRFTRTDRKKIITAVSVELGTLGGTSYSDSHFKKLAPKFCYDS